MELKRIDSRAIVAILIFIGVGFGYSVYAHKKEKNILLEQFTRINREKNESKLKADEVLKSIAPLQEEIKYLRSVIVQEKTANNPVLEKETYVALPKAQKTPEDQGGKRGRILDTEKGLTRLKSYVKTMEEENAVFKEKAAQLRAQLDEKEKELHILNSAQGSLKEAMENVAIAKNKLESEVNAQSDSLKETKNGLALKESEISALQKTKQNLQSHVAELNDKLTVSSTSAASMEKQLAQSRQDASLLENELEKARKDLETQRSLSEPSQKKVLELTEVLADREKELSAATKELEQLKESKKAFESELSELKLVKIANENQINQMNLRINESTFSYESLKSTVSQLSNLLTKKEIELSERQKEISSLKENLGASVEEKATLLTALKEKEKTVNELNGSVSRMSAQIAAFQEQLSLPNKVQAKTMEQLDQLTSVSSFLQERLTGISKELESIHTQTEQDKKKAEDLRKRVEVILDIDKGKEETEQKEE